MNILVCDDKQDRSEEVIGRIREAGLPAPKQLVGEDLTKALKALFADVKSCIEDPEKWKPRGRLLFDDADIIVLDNNLAHLELEGARLTAESIAGYIRAFTAAPYIVSINKNPDVDFDLRYLVGDYSTRADVALNTDHLANSALWSGDRSKAKNGFIPWYWPRLSSSAGQRRAQIDFVAAHLDDSVIETLGFDDKAIELLAPHAQGALSSKAEFDDVGGDGIPFKKVSFRHVFLAKDRSLPVQDDREDLSDAEKAGNKEIRRIIARTVAADIDLWFRRDIVGPQEPLVDLPHLLMRFPFLLADRAKNANEWNKVVGEAHPPFAIEKKLYDEYLAKARFTCGMWVQNECYWWHKLKDDEKLNEFFFRAKEGEWADMVFCEDRSAFAERVTKNGIAPPMEFPVEFEGSWGRRYIAKIENIGYAPRTRLAI